MLRTAPKFLFTNILTPGGYFDCQDKDLLHVNKFSCRDFMGAIIASPSDNVKKSISCNLSGAGASSNRIRIPSNFVSESQFRILVSGNAYSDSWKLTVSEGYCSSGETSMSVSSDILIHRVRNGSDTVIRRVKSTDTKVDNKYKIDLSGLMGGDEIYMSTEAAMSHTGVYWYWHRADSDGGDGYYNRYTHSVSCNASTCSGFSVACEVANYASAGAVWD